MTTAIYHTEISHYRRTPRQHSFRNRSASWYFDVDAPPQVPRWLRPFVSFRADDHLAPAPTGPDTLRNRVEHTLRQHSRTPSTGPITALLNARCLGYVFDPLSVFWCHSPSGRLEVVVAEVHNTYGGRHAYVLEPTATDRALVDKEFYVSPFNPVDGTYRLRLPEPDERLNLEVVLNRTGHAPFVATWRGSRRPATYREALRTQLRAPLAPLVVSARIRWHGIRLWAKGLPIVPRPTESTPNRPSTRK